MTTDQLVLILGFLTTFTGGIGFWLSRSYFPHRQTLQQAQQADLTRQREHEREMARNAAAELNRQREHERELAATKAAADLQLAATKAAADLAEEGAVLKQMGILQTSLMIQAEQFSEFIIHLATTRADISDKNARKDALAAIEKWAAITGELKGIRESLAIVIQQTKWNQQGLKEMPDYLLKYITKQELFYSQFQKLLGDIAPAGAGEVSRG